MRVRDLMTDAVKTATPSTRLEDVARLMRDEDIGSVPVAENEKLVGMVTDRDIVVRGVAQEADTTSMRLADVMSTNVRCATEDEDVDDVLDEMARNQIRRMPVVDRKEHLVGIISLGDIAAKTSDEEMDLAHSLGEISEPASPDRSSQSRASGAAGGGSSSGKSRKPH